MKFEIKKVLLLSICPITTLTPMLLSSCSNEIIAENKEEKDEFNNDESGENSSNNNNLSVNKPDKNNKPITNIPVLNVKNSDLHEYSLEFLKNKTPYEIMLNSNTYKHAIS